jgi:hypothetical protein
MFDGEPLPSVVTIVATDLLIVPKARRKLREAVALAAVLASAISVRERDRAVASNVFDFVVLKARIAFDT